MKEEAGRTDSKKTPNILFLVTDQQRRNSLGIYGNKYVSTPNLDALGAGATVYEHAYCNTPVCTPSRAAILTGKTISGHGVYNLFDIMPREEKLLPYYLKEAGYRTGLIGKLHVSGIKFEETERLPYDGFDTYELCHEPSIMLDAPYNTYGKWLRENYPDEYEELRVHGRAVKNRPVHSHFTTWVSERSARYIRERDKSKPFFLWAGYFDPHSPYDHHPKESEALLHEEYREPIVHVDGEEESCPEGMKIARSIQCRDPLERFDAAKAEQLRRGYFSGISFIDQQLGKIIEALKDEGIYDDTMIIYTSDHGDMMLDHNLIGKGAYMYDDCTNVPLIIKYPGQTRGERSQRLVQLNDLFATALDAAGCDGSVVCESLPLRGEKQRDCAVTEFRGSGQLDLGIFPHPLMATMVRGEKYKLSIYHDSMEMQLFDMENDPDEKTDLSHDPQHSGVIIDLMQRYMRDAVAADYRLNSARGGRSATPDFSGLAKRLKENNGMKG